MERQRRVGAMASEQRFLKTKPVAVGLAAASLALLGSCGRAPPPSPPPPTVTVATPLQREIVDWDDYVGRFEAIQDTQVVPRVSGQIVRVGFAEGRTVRKGQFLFEIDPRPFRAVLAQAQAQAVSAAATLTNARSEVARARSLLDQQAASREEYEQKLAAVRTAEAGVQGARAAVRARALDLEFTTVRAPITGRASDKRVAIGDYVTAGQTLLTRLVSIDPIWFTFDGAEPFYLKYIRAAQQGQRPSSRYAPNPVDIQLADENSYRWHGHMVFVDNAIDTGSGTIKAHAVVANPDGFLIPGMFGRARLLGSGRYRAMLIPDDAIMTDQTRRLVFVIGRDGKTVPRVVETGALVDGLRVIRSGLAPTDRLVLDGLARLQPGMPVKARAGSIVAKPSENAVTSTPISAPAPAEATSR